MSDKRTMFYGASPQIFETAKELRENMTSHELLLWDKLKSNQLLGLRFKAQHPIKSFIADFYCHKLKMVIEIDGDTHASMDAKEYDAAREDEMKEFEIKTIRFFNKDVENNLDDVLEKLRMAVIQRSKELNLIFDGTQNGNFVTNQPFTPTLKGEADFGSIESPL